MRVRKALYQAIDIAAIQKTVMRGLAQPTGTMIAPQVNGWTKQADQRWPYNLDAAKSSWLKRATPTALGGLCLPQQPLHQRRAHLPGHHRHVGQGRGQGQSCARPLVSYFPMIQRYGQHLHAGLGRPTFDALSTACSHCCALWA